MAGSSPRVRGAVGPLTVEVQALGIIPARAGSSSRKSASSSTTRDHPRACGEQALCESGDSISVGSSPRVRGADALPDTRGHLFGIIPARAGSRSRGAAFGTPVRDHPRACGEQVSPRVLRNPHVGSSPRVRGAVSAIYRYPKTRGIIPARAGSSFAGGVCRSLA